MTSYRLQLFTLLTAAVVGVSLSQDALHATADNILKKVCVNGAAQAQGPNYKRTNTLDAINLSDTWNSGGTGCISIEAWNTEKNTDSGILACVTSVNYHTAMVWKCAPRHVVKAVVAGGCCSACGHSFWTTYPQHIGVHTRKPSSSLTDKLPDQCKDELDEAMWRWYKDVRQPKVCCTIQACAPLCLDCSTSGPGQCDKCIFGHNVPSPTPAPPPQQTCASKCCVEVFTSPDDAVFPRVTMTNKANNVDTRKTCSGPFCLMILNIDKCEIAEDFVFEFDWQSIDVINPKNILSEYMNVVYIDMQSGSGFNWLPWITIQAMLGTGGPGLISFTPEMYGRYTYTATCFTGYQQGVLVTTNTITRV